MKIAASNLGVAGKKQKPLAAGNIAIMPGAAKPSAIPTGTSVTTWAA
jgi:hypothetical protein